MTDASAASAASAASVVPVLASLPPAWQDWIADNLARGCSARDMADSMANSGQYSIDVARAALDEAVRQRRSGVRDFSATGAMATNATTATTATAAAPAMPFIDTSRNKILVDGREVELLFVLKRPQVILLGNVLSAEECDAIVEHCGTRYTRSTVTAADDGASVVHEGRTSDMAFIQRGEAEIAERIEQRLATLANWPAECGEPFQLQKYASTQEYRPHYDWLDPDTAGHRSHLARGGQRLATFILYLTEVEQGGSTIFPGLGLEVMPKKGSALWFLNTDSNFHPDRQTLHGGAPVVAGTKIIANKWLRQERYG